MGYSHSFLVKFHTLITPVPILEMMIRPSILIPDKFSLTYFVSMTLSNGTQITVPLLSTWFRGSAAFAVLLPFLILFAKSSSNERVTGGLSPPSRIIHWTLYVFRICENMCKTSPTGWILIISGFSEISCSLSGNSWAVGALKNPERSFDRTAEDNNSWSWRVIAVGTATEVGKS